MKKTFLIILCAISPLLLSSCWGGKDDATTPRDLANQMLTDSPYTLEELEELFSGSQNTPIDVADVEVDTVIISNHLAGGMKNIKALIESLTGSDIATVEKRAYLKSYMGDYSGAIAEREKICEDTPDNCGKKTINLDIGTMIDKGGAPVLGTNIYLNASEVKSDGAIAQVEVYDDMVHRVRVEKEGYLDSFAKVNGVEGVDILFDINPVMEKAPMSVIVDNQVGGTYSVGTGTGQITYTIAPDTFVDAEGKIVQGPVNVYLFSLGNESQGLSVFNLDTFTPDGTNVGSSMITDGMPFVTAYRDGMELTIARPIEGVGTMELNQTFDVDLDLVPKNTWLGNTELQEYGLPGYWRLDRKSGVWIESQMQVLDESGKYKFNFQ